MNKRKLHHQWTRIRPFSSWYFLAAFLFFGLVFTFAYRQNNLTAIKLRDEVLKVDQQNGDVEAALRKLREFTYQHMNADLSGGQNAAYPPIQLKYRYERLMAAEQERVAATSGNLYNDAQKFCEQKFPEGLLGASRLPCIQEYLDSHGSGDIKANPVPDALYKFDFASPAWSPDLAGWSLLVSILFLILFIIRFVLERWLRHTLRES